MPIFSWKNLFFSTLLIGISAGTLYAFGAYDNVFPYGTPFPPGHWNDVQVGDVSICYANGGSWLWVYGYPTDTGGLGCVVNPEQPLTFTSTSTGWVSDPGSGFSALLSCYLHCPNS